MQDFSDLYNTFNQVNEQRKRNNFNYFMYGLITGFEHDLDKEYIEDREQYEKSLKNIKANGFRVFRNSQGKHKVIVGETVNESPLP